MKGFSLFLFIFYFFTKPIFSKPISAKLILDGKSTTKNSVLELCIVLIIHKLSCVLLATAPHKCWLLRDYRCAAGGRISSPLTNWANLTHNWLIGSVWRERWLVYSWFFSDLSSRFCHLWGCYANVFVILFFEKWRETICLILCWASYSKAG